MIDDDVRVTVLGLKGNQVRIGIEAPRETPVHRLEIWKRIQDEEKDKKRPQSGGSDYDSRGADYLDGGGNK